MYCRAVLLQAMCDAMGGECVARYDVDTGSQYICMLYIHKKQLWIASSIGFTSTHAGSNHANCCQRPQPSRTLIHTKRCTRSYQDAWVRLQQLYETSMLEHVHTNAALVKHKTRQHTNVQQRYVQSVNDESGSCHGFHGCKHYCLSQVKHGVGVL